MYHWLPPSSIPQGFSLKVTPKQDGIWSEKVKNYLPFVLKYFQKLLFNQITSFFVCSIYGHACVHIANLTEIL